jgi:hypothetical protein
MEEKVRIAEMKIQVRTTKPKVGTKPLVTIQVEITETIIKEINV